MAVQAVPITPVPDPVRPFWEVHKRWLAPTLVVITLTAIVLSVLGESAGIHPDWLLAVNIISYLAGGFYGTLSAINSLRHRKLDIDLLMILAALGAATIDQWHEGAILLFLFSLSNVLQDYAIGRSRKAISGLMKLYPSDAHVMREGKVSTIPIAQIHIGDMLLIAPGERIPVDGIVRAGASSVDQSPITGESLPVEKAPGDKVFAGTLNQQGALDVEATQAAQDTMLARIIRMVEEAQESKAPTERFLDRFEEIYAFVIVFGIALFIIVPPLLMPGMDFPAHFYRAMVLMTVASPCALVISTPAAFLSAIASGARRGVLFKGGAYLENLATIGAVAFDKTGTLTQGRPALTDVVPAHGISTEELLRLAASVESRSEHPLAQAVVQGANALSIPLSEVQEFHATTGRGVEGIVEGLHMRVGSPASLNEPLNGDLGVALASLQNEGKTVMVVRRDERPIGLLAVSDEVRPEAHSMIRRLSAMKIGVVMLTGDHRKTADYIAHKLGIDRVEADLLPTDKVAAIERSRAASGRIAMVGDGVNDAPALANADIGIAMGAAGSDVALETADLVLMGDRLELIPYAIQLSRKARRVVWQNITFSLAVIVVLVISTFALDLALTTGVFGHEGSTVIVVTNGLLQLLILPEITRRRASRV